jgi:hypothetical protein
MNKDVAKKRMCEVTAVILSVLLLVGVFSCFSVLADGEESKSPYVILRADEIITRMSNPNATSFTLDTRDGFPVVNLTFDTDSNDGYVTVNMADYSATEYKYVTILTYAEIYDYINFGIYYHTGARGPADMTYGEDAKGNSLYEIMTGWQFLEFDMSHTENWGGEMYKLRFDYMERGVFPAGTRCDIAAIILSSDAKAVHDAAYQLMLEIYPPVQTLGDFDQTDIQFFNSSKYHAEPVNTRVSSENGSIIYSYVSHPEHNDPRVTFDYIGYTKHREIATLTTDDFRYAVIRYRAPAIADSVMELFTITGNAESLFDMIRIEDTYTCHSAVASYRAANAWSAMVLDLAEDDGLPENTGLKYGWMREDGDRTFKGLRIDWCARGSIGFYMEISDFIFYADENAANNVSMALASLTLGENLYWGTEPDETETEDESDDEEFPWETEEETTEEETTEETIPEYDNGTTEEATEDVSEETTAEETTEEDTTEESTETETSSEDETKSEVILPGGIGGDTNTPTDKGSELPFHIACGSLAALSVASIASVVTIRVKDKKKNKQ